MKCALIARKAVCDTPENHLIYIVPLELKFFILEVSRDAMIFQFFERGT